MDELFDYEALPEFEDQQVGVGVSGAEMPSSELLNELHASANMSPAAHAEIIETETDVHPDVDADACNETSELPSHKEASSMLGVGEEMEVDDATGDNFSVESDDDDNVDEAKFSEDSASEVEVS